MKVALYNSFPHIPHHAEANFILEAITALRNLGHQGVEVSSLNDILASKPDVVLTTHEFTPKLSDIPTIGLMWNPPDFLRCYPDKIQNLLTYDGYMSGSRFVTDYLRQILMSVGKKAPISEFIYCTCAGTPFLERDPDPLSLFYVAGAWDKRRYRDLLLRLSDEIPVHVYGAKDFNYLGNSYKGSIPNGKAFLDQIRRCGIGLALHRHEHRVASCPSRRLFEISAASAVIIGDDFEFSRRYFEGAMLFVDTSKSQMEMAGEIIQHYRRLNDHYEEAMLMAQASHSIFASQFCLEQLLVNLPSFVQDVLSSSALSQQVHLVSKETDNKNSVDEESRTLRDTEATSTENDVIAVSVGCRSRDIPIFINNRNRLGSLKALLAWLSSVGYTKIFIIDNNSTYPPLLDYYRQLSSNSEVTLIQLKENKGPYALWEAGLLEKYQIRTPFVYTDSDIVPTSSCPADVLDYFQRLLIEYPDFEKIGLGLKIDDLPDCCKYKEAVVLWESQFWRSAVNAELYNAAVDTTFALYRSPRMNPRFVSGPALRSGYPYLARHTPWYTDSEHPNEEDQYYEHHCLPSASFWSTSHEQCLARLQAVMNKLNETEAQLQLVLSSSNITTRCVGAGRRLFRWLRRHGLRAALKKCWLLVQKHGFRGAFREIKLKLRSLSRSHVG